MASRRAWILDETIACLAQPIGLGACVLMLLSALRFLNKPFTYAVTNSFLGVSAHSMIPDAVFNAIPFVPPIILAGLYAEAELKRGAYGILRIGSYRRWWLRKVSGMAAGLIIYWLSYFLLIALVVRASGHPLVLENSGGMGEIPPAAYKLMLPMVYINSLLFSMAALLLQAATGDQRLALGVPLATLFASGIIGQQVPSIAFILPGSWGMLWRSTLLETLEVIRCDPWVSLIVQASLIAAGCVWLPRILRRYEFANRKQL